jgi:hypothetical protein
MLRLIYHTHYILGYFTVHKIRAAYRLFRNCDRFDTCYILKFNSIYYNLDIYASSVYVEIHTRVFTIKKKKFPAWFIRYVENYARIEYLCKEYYETRRNRHRQQISSILDGLLHI